MNPIKIAVSFKLKMMKLHGILPEFHNFKHFCLLFIIRNPFFLTSCGVCYTNWRMLGQAKFLKWKLTMAGIQRISNRLSIGYVLMYTFI